MITGYMHVIEECGALVDAGLMDRAEAVATVHRASGGGLTPLGAESMLSEWQTARARLADIFMTAELGMAACQDAIRRQGPGRQVA
ncbi:MAG TPA: hypothetical protein VFR23_25575 [Jiangellaceae bacterium]|nr:hypothetical protein [Jiangellaceae bacterium]